MRGRQREIGRKGAAKWFKKFVLKVKKKCEKIKKIFFMNKIVL